MNTNEAIINTYEDTKNINYERQKIEIDYRNKKILAPMVRVGTLPFRLLALEYGADIVYSEELIDKKLIKTKRVVNERLRTVEYITEKGEVVYQTCASDTPSVLQIGTASSDLALQSALHLYRDYDALDVNMGCPKHFSISGGMGCGLLKDKQRVNDILRTLTSKIDKPVTCKIRLLDKIEETIDMVKLIEQTGVKAVAVHARYIPQRPREPAHLDLLPNIVSAVNIPVIANGDIFKREDIEVIKKKTGCSSVMIARGALNNISIFSKEEAPKSEISSKYVQKCIEYGTKFGNCKYTLMKIYGDSTKQQIFQDIVNSKSYSDLW